MKCLIITGGDVVSKDILDREIANADYIIVADSGYDKLDDYDIVPDLILGDFDSIENIDELRSHVDYNVMEYPAKKNYTDTELAVREAIKRNAKSVVIIGGTGTRYDHSLSNVFLLQLLDENGVSGKIIDDNNIVIYAENREVQVVKEYENLSIIPLDKEGLEVSTVGMEYELYDEILYFSSSRGVSNIISGQSGKVRLHRGRALIIQSRD